MTRIIAGSLGGRRIETPKGEGTRPTSDRVREAMFSSLESELGGFDGVRVLDLFAGSGALGLEALSRGAGGATFVDSDARAVAAIKQNVRTLGVAGTEVIRSTATAFVDRPHDEPVHLVFVDPPYVLATDSVTELVRRMAQGMAGGALFIVERSSRTPFVWPEGVEPLRHKKYGETTVWYGH